MSDRQETPEEAIQSLANRRIDGEHPEGTIVASRKAWRVLVYFSIAVGFISGTLSASIIWMYVLRAH